MSQIRTSRNCTATCQSQTAIFSAGVDKTKFFFEKKVFRFLGFLKICLKFLFRF